MTTTERDFERIWKSVESIIHGTLLSGDIENIFDTANGAWDLEKEKWRDPVRVHYNFLLALRKKNPLCAKRFSEAIEKFSFKKVKLPAPPSLVPYIFGTLCFATAGACAGYLLPEDSFLPRLIGQLPTIFLGGSIFAGIGNGIFGGLRKNKIKALLKNSANLYVAQLNPLRQSLIELCRKADVAK